MCLATRRRSVKALVCRARSAIITRVVHPPAVNPPSTMTRPATRRLAVVAIVSALSIVAAATAGDWPRFRGPNGTGVAADATIPTEFKQGDGILWKVPLPGKGNSSPVISRGKLFLQTASDDGHERQLLCLDAVTGK